MLGVFLVTLTVYGSLFAVLLVLALKLAQLVKWAVRADVEEYRARKHATRRRSYSRR